MAEICKCGLGLSNTGQEKCPVASVTYGVFGVSIEANDGTLNKIDAAQTLDAAYLSDRLNDTDESKRWFPIMDLRNVTDVRNESEFETDSAGNVAELRQGTRPFFGEDWNSTPEFLGKIEGWKCSDFGLFVVDINGGMVVRAIDSTGDAYPLPVDRNSFVPRLIVAQDANIQKVGIGFNWHNELMDSELRYIQSATWGDANLKGAKGLFDISATITNISSSQLTIELFKSYGDYRDRIGDKGVVLADVMFEGISPVVAPFAPATWVPDATDTSKYVATFSPVLTTGTYRPKISKTGRNYTEANKVDIVIP